MLEIDLIPLDGAYSGCSSFSSVSHLDAYSICEPMSSEFGDFGLNQNFICDWKLMNAGASTGYPSTVRSRIEVPIAWNGCIRSRPLITQPLTHNATIARTCHNLQGQLVARHGYREQGCEH